MIIPPSEYHLVPLICAILGAILGNLAVRKEASAKPILGAVLLTFSGAVAELLWHESDRLNVFDEPRVIFSMVLALTIPTAAAFIAQSIVSKRNWNPALSISAVAVPVLVFLLLYPAYALYILCYVGHDCI